MAEYEVATRLAPRSIEAYVGLAATEAAVGDHTRALTAAGRARELAVDEGRTSTVAEIDRRIAEYRTAAGGGDAR